MKAKSIIAHLALNLLLAWASLGQSSFYFANGYFPPLVDAPVFDAQGALLDGPNYVAELWGGATPDSLVPAVTYASRQRIIVPFFTGAGAGYFRDSGMRGFGDLLTVLEVPPYTTLAWLEVRAWDVRLGVTYEEVAVRGLGGYGESPLFSAYGSYPLDLLGVPEPLIGLQSFALREVIPEPSPTWLLLVGLPLLLLRRRRFK